jgi:hypothetical protein
MKRTRQFVLFSALCVSALAGCGSSSQRSAPAPYIAQANAICRSQLARLRHLEQPTTPAQAIDYLPPALAIMRSETRMLGALDPPAGARAKLAAAVAGTRQLSAVLQQFLGRLQHGLVEFAVLASVQMRSARIRAAIDTRFHEAGLTACNE